MTTEKNQHFVEMRVTDSLAVAVLPNTSHEYLMTSREVESGYGVTEHALRMTRLRNSNEFKEGRHFVLGKEVTDCYPHGKIQGHAILWTKRGIVRLGFFIKSERARLFRDWAEELVLSKLEQAARVSPEHTTKALPPRRRHNRLTAERLVSIMADVACIEDKAIRMSITSKLLGGGAL